MSLFLMVQMMSSFYSLHLRSFYREDRDFSFCRAVAEVPGMASQEACARLSTWFLVTEAVPAPSSLLG